MVTYFFTLSFHPNFPPIPPITNRCTILHPHGHNSTGCHFCTEEKTEYLSLRNGRKYRQILTVTLFAGLERSPFHTLKGETRKQKQGQHGSSYTECADLVRICDLKLRGKSNINNQKVCVLHIFPKSATFLF